MRAISVSNTNSEAMQFSAPMQRIADATHHDPFSVLGLHRTGDHYFVRVFNPLAETVSVADSGQAFERIAGTDFFVLTADSVPPDNRLSWTDRTGSTHIHHDPYRFGPTLSDFDLHLFNEGRHLRLYEILGAHQLTVDDVTGIRFAVWAPSALRVSVVGDFNQWDGRINPMRCRGDSGVWELFLPDVKAGEAYKFELRTNDPQQAVITKQDPCANEFEIRPKTACRVSTSTHCWKDDEWISERRKNQWQHSPASVYEVHLGSWHRDDKGQFLNYRAIAGKLVEYVTFMGFTHIELMPVTEHPLDDSWGYQVTGYFAPSSRFGSPDDFRYLVDLCHQAKIGVILDWVPAHFPKDAFSLARYDGTCLYEHQDPRLGEHRDWGTLIFNYGRREVCNFLLASALYWLREFHLDGLRVDAVASMLYLDYSRESGDWLPNKYGGRENIEAVEFLRTLNHVTQSEVPGSVIIAEESTSWPQVSRPAEHGGLGFSMKWNMGWMHDTLTYFNEDPINRKYHHHVLTFGILYVFTENFVLPFSHDEVVHGKGSMLAKMPGDDWQQFANLRLLYAYQFSYPGKKLIFQGCEFAQRNEWNCNTTLDWHLTEAPAHRGVMQMLADLNRLYRKHKGLHEAEFESSGFEWLNADDSENSVLAWLRHSSQETLLVVLNFTPVPRVDYCLPFHGAASFEEVFNSDSEIYGGSNTPTHQQYKTIDRPLYGSDHSLSLNLPPLAALILQQKNS